jgi:hypothetical protein
MFDKINANKVGFPCVYVYVYAYAYVYVYVYVYMCMCMTFVNTYIHEFLVFWWAPARSFLCLTRRMPSTYGCMYACMYVCYL